MFRNIFLLSFSLSLVLSSGSSLPGWEDLQCEEGHKYLFSDTSHTWQDAREECELYGGWLLSINSLQEQNCLVRFAKTSGLHHGWFWHDATDRDTESVYVHASHGSDLTWIPHLWRCSKTSGTGVDIYDFVLLGLHGDVSQDDYMTGAWCTRPETSNYYFICE